MPFVGDGGLIDELPAEAIATIVELAGPGASSPLAGFELRQAGGALGRAMVGHGVTAGVAAPFVRFCGGLVLSPEMGEAVHARIGALRAALAPWSGDGEYLNFAERKVDLSRSFDEAAYLRLGHVKARLDPENLIQANHEIRPA
jgi:hypothetical protein